MQLRWVVTAVVMAAVLSSCSSDGDAADAEAGTTTATTPAATSPSPSPSPVTTAPAPDSFPGITMTFSGGAADDARVEAIKTFVAGSADAQRQYRLAPTFRAVLSRDLQRFWSTGVVDVQKKGWTVPAAPVARLVSLSEKGGTAEAVLCRWSPSTDFVRRSDGKNVEGNGRAWNRVDMTLERAGDTWVLTRVEGKGVRQPGCPR